MWETRPLTNEQVAGWLEAQYTGSPSLDATDGIVAEACRRLRGLQASGTRTHRAVGRVVMTQLEEGENEIAVPAWFNDIPAPGTVLFVVGSE